MSRIRVAQKASLKIGSELPQTNGSQTSKDHRKKKMFGMKPKPQKRSNFEE
jgi:hypothetical protein